MSHNTPESYDPSVGEVLSEIAKWCAEGSVNDDTGGEVSSRKQRHRQAFSSSKSEDGQYLAVASLLAGLVGSIEESASSSPPKQSINTNNKTARSLSGSNRNGNVPPKRAGGFHPAPLSQDSGRSQALGDPYQQPPYHGYPYLPPQAAPPIGYPMSAYHHAHQHTTTMPCVPCGYQHPMMAGRGPADALPYPYHSCGTFPQGSPIMNTMACYAADPRRAGSVLQQAHASLEASLSTSTSGTRRHRTHNKDKRKAKDASQKVHSEGPKRPDDTTTTLSLPHPSEVTEDNPFPEIPEPNAVDELGRLIVVVDHDGSVVSNKKRKQMRWKQIQEGLLVSQNQQETHVCDTEITEYAVETNPGTDEDGGTDTDGTDAPGRPTDGDGFTQSTSRASSFTFNRTANTTSSHSATGAAITNADAEAASDRTCHDRAQPSDTPNEKQRQAYLMDASHGIVSNESVRSSAVPSPPPEVDYATAAENDGSRSTKPKQASSDRIGQAKPSKKATGKSIPVVTPSHQSSAFPAPPPPHHPAYAPYGSPQLSSSPFGPTGSSGFMAVGPPSLVVPHQSPATAAPSHANSSGAILDLTATHDLLPCIHPRSGFTVYMYVPRLRPSHSMPYPSEAPYATASVPYLQRKEKKK